MKRFAQVFLAVSAACALSFPAKSADKSDERFFNALAVNHSATCLLEVANFKMKYVYPFATTGLKVQGLTWDDFREFTKSPNWDSDAAWLWRQKGGRKGCESSIMFFTELMEEKGISDYRE